MRSLSRPALGGIVAVTGAVLFVLFAVLWVPWEPIPGGSVPPVAATDYFTAQEIQRGEDYAHWARIWGLTSLGVSLLISCVLGFTTLGPRLVARLPGRWWLQVPLAVAALAVVGRVLTLPFAVAGRQHALDYDLSRQAWTGFAADQARAQAVGIVMTSIVVLIVVGSARRWPTIWPAIAGSLAAGAVLVGSLVYPVVVEPVFNDFTSLPEGPLRTEILQLAEREGVAIDDVLVADASRRTTTLNAYVSGIGSTKRVVVYDNLVEDLGEPETLSVIAHELSHAQRDDVLHGSLLGSAGALLALGLLGLLWRGEGNWVGEARSVPRLLALGAVAALLTSPLHSGISRQIEARADVDALATTGDPDALIGLQQELARRAATDVTPPAWLHFWFGSHPTTMQRIALAESIELTRPQIPAPGSGG
ncbi:M48 family metallopeptidase [Nocardioides sp.]|uniref:M48 family metallopeptidase n=1 Tax=Nocardioides sp. TaxID=35761 RepID=UPI0035624EF3